MVPAVTAPLPAFSLRVTMNSFDEMATAFLAYAQEHGVALVGHGWHSDLAERFRSADSAGYARGVSSATDAMLAARTGEKA